MDTNRLLARTTLMAALSMPALAAAAPVTVAISGANWTLLDSDWGPACSAAAGCDDSHTELNVSWTINPFLAGTNIVLDGVGDFATVLFGSATLAEEDDKLSAAEAETDEATLGANLEFASPTARSAPYAANVEAFVGVFWDKDKDKGKGKGNGSANADLKATFLPLLVGFDDGSKIEIQFSSAEWDCEGNGGQCTWDKPTTRQINATFTLRNEALASGNVGVQAVPEPSSMLLIGAGLVGLGFGRRRQKSA